MNVLITGSRSIVSALPVYLALEKIHKSTPIAKIIHGNARGVDLFADGWAQYRGIEVIQMPADWREHGRSAGMRRNEAMLNMKPDIVQAIWDGVSKGTAHMMKISSGLDVRCVSPVEGEGIQVRNLRGSPVPPGGEYIGNGSILVNPYRGDKIREHACMKYVFHLYSRKDKTVQELRRLYEIWKLHGSLDLWCFCDPLACHGHVVRDLLYLKSKR